MNAISAVPMEVRLGLLFVLGACGGSLVNWAVYRLAFQQRSISPWSAPAKGAPPRRWSDRIPIVGWLGLRRESVLHGSWFWVRPLLVELFVGLGCAWLYWWEVDRQGLLPLNLLRKADAGLLAMLHAQYLGHVVLILLMTAASLIDADEKTIPDAITLSGTLFGLLWVTVTPWALLPVAQRLPGGMESIQFLNITTPHPWPTWLTGSPQPWSLVIALGCWWLWCVGLLPRRWYSRHGWCRALGLLCARLARDAATRWILLMGLVGSAGVTGVWMLGGDRWKGLLSALVGMAASGVMIWAVRIVGGATMRREVMGFGDVTLTAMIGTLLGWQTGLLIFFAAPLIAIGVGLLSVILHREHEIPYGPFLCMAALLAIVRWADVWVWAKSQVFILGLWVPGALVVCLALMPPLLMAVLVIVDFVRRLLFGAESDK